MSRTKVRKAIRWVVEVANEPYKEFVVGLGEGRTDRSWALHDFSAVTPAPRLEGQKSG